MTRRSGSADLPLHGGYVPKWLADRMSRLGAVICQAIVHHYGRDELLRRLSHPIRGGERGLAPLRLVAKVDSAAVQDGFDLYLHGFIVTNEGHWVVVQQGMNEDRRQARRYHWLSEGLRSFVEEPHSAIEGEGLGEIVNLTRSPRRILPSQPNRPSGSH